MQNSVGSDSYRTPRRTLSQLENKTFQKRGKAKF
jgi:hypothetical protein